MTTPHTQLIYLEHMNILIINARILDIQSLEDEKYAIILDKTIFYPQGGGQPYDQGIIESPDHQTIFQVNEVRFKDGIVYHIGSYKNGSFDKNDIVELHVNEKRRVFNSRNHTAGHLIDIAMRNIDMNLTPGKGYHFPVGAYVEYAETQDEKTREQLKIKLEEEVNKLVQQTLPVQVKLVSMDELREITAYIPEYLPKDKPTRAMIVQGYPAIPCGGTHAENTAQVGPVTIKKIKNEKGNLRVSYEIKEMI